MSGILVWVKQAGASTTSYPAGFTNETKAVGSLYVAPAATGKVLNLSRAGVSFSGGNLGANFNNVVSVNAGSSVVNLSPNPLTLTITPTLGSFTGQVAKPGTGVVHPFGGVVLQKQNAGYGFMVGRQCQQPRRFRRAVNSGENSGLNPNFGFRPSILGGIGSLQSENLFSPPA